MFIFLFLAAFGAFMALPLVYAVVNAFKPLNEIFLFPPRFFVQHPTLGNFFMLFKLTANLWVPFSRYIFNSLFICVITTAGSVIICSLAAYPLAKYNLSFKWLFSIVVMTLLFNGTVLDIPNFIIISKLNIMNTYWAYVLPNLAVPLGVFLMKQFMTQIPDSLIEAARIDGASQYTIFWRIVMPSVKPAWLTLVIFSFQAIWNQQGIGVIFDEELKTMPAAINQIVQGGIARTGAAMAGSLFLMTPPIVIFLLTQKSVIETMVHSGIKE
ncbi:ABC transporter permease [Paenibacillus baekrokdamisoli]|uniref:ABC transporter permease n=2 Tax=Paenibacillus baekrokdamisoli TaxID=1712516 RepID=A0A3G9J6L1_9BACL|nr:ABC transporter permease [Paenibacillus baekrokdamisoli]